MATPRHKHALLQLNFVSLSLMRRAWNINTVTKWGTFHPIMEGYSGSRCAVLLYLIYVLDGGQWSQPRPDRFTPGNYPVPTVQEAGWPQDWSGWMPKISPTSRFDPRTVKPVVSCAKRLKIFGFCIFRHHYSAVNNTVTESTCRSQSKCFYFMHARATAVLQIGRSLVRCQLVSVDFHWHKILPAALWPWGRLSL